MNHPAQPAPEGALPPILPIDRQLAHDLVRPFIDMQGLGALEAAEVACQHIANWRVALPDNAALRARCERLEGGLQPAAYAIRALRSTIETIDSDECERAREEHRSALVHTSVLNESRVALEDALAALAQPEDGK